MTDVSGEKAFAVRPGAPIILGVNKLNAVFQSAGDVQMATTTSGSPNYYVFSDSGAGIRPFIIVGTAWQIVEFMLENLNKGIKNTRSNPGESDIYVGVKLGNKDLFQENRNKLIAPANDAFMDIFGTAMKIFYYSGIDLVAKDVYNIKDGMVTPGGFKAPVVSDISNALGDIVNVFKTANLASPQPTLGYVNSAISRIKKLLGRGVGAEQRYQLVFYFSDEDKWNRIPDKMSKIATKELSFQKFLAGEYKVRLS